MRFAIAEIKENKCLMSRQIIIKNNHVSQTKNKMVNVRSCNNENKCYNEKTI